MERNVGDDVPFKSDARFADCRYFAFGDIPVGACITAYGKPFKILRP